MNPPSAPGADRRDGVLLRESSDEAPFDAHLSSGGTLAWRDAHAGAAAAERPSDDQAYRDYRNTRFFSSLDGLRALSILAVIWHHSAGAGMSSWIARQGGHGVTLFFVISGFLIPTLLIRSREAHRTISLRQFWVRRILRIFPAYYAVLGAYLILVVLLEKDVVYRTEFFENLRAYLTFTSNWFVDLDEPRVIFYFAWSLAAEEQFYFFWPWVERCRGHVGAIAIATAVLLAAQSTAFVWGARTQGVLPLRIVAGIPSAILLGVMLAHGLHWKACFRWIVLLSGRRGAGILALLLTAGALAAGPSLGRAQDLVVSVCLTLLVSSCVIREDNDFAWFLTLPAVAWIGKISYGMYLMHMLCVGIVHRGAARLGMSSVYGEFLAAVALSIAVASLSFVFYEERFLRMKKTFSQR